MNPKNPEGRAAGGIAPPNIFQNPLKTTKPESRRDTAKPAQRAQYCLIKEYTSNHDKDPYMT